MSNWLGLREDQRIGEGIAGLLTLELNKIVASTEARLSANASPLLCLIRPHHGQARRAPGAPGMERAQTVGCVASIEGR